MLITRRIYVSLPADRWLSPSMNDLKWAIVEEIENLGYTPEIFTNPKGKPGLASSKGTRGKSPGIGGLKGLRGAGMEPICCRHVDAQEDQPCHAVAG